MAKDESSPLAVSSSPSSPPTFTVTKPATPIGPIVSLPTPTASLTAPILSEEMETSEENTRDKTTPTLAAIEVIDLTQLQDVVMVTIEDSMEAKKISDISNQVGKYEISLETIDQAILELGPFAKDIDHQERLESIPLEWTPVEFAAKKDRRRSSPAHQSARNLRMSTDEPSPLVLVGSPGRDQHGKGRRGGGSRKKPPPPPPKETSVESPPISGDSQSTDSLPSTVSQETSAAEAMLALSTGGHTSTSTLVPSDPPPLDHRPLDQHSSDHHPPLEPREKVQRSQQQQVAPPTTAETMPHPPPVVVATTKGEERTQKQPALMYHQPPMWKTAPQMPALNRIVPSDRYPHKRRTSSSSSHYSAMGHVMEDGRHLNYSPNPLQTAKVTSNSAHPQYVVEPSSRAGGKMVSPHNTNTEDDKILNPFWPVPPGGQGRQPEVPTSVAGYPLVSLQGPWNPATYRPYIPLASFPRASAEGGSLDVANTAAATLQQMVSPYNMYLLPQRYSFQPTLPSPFPPPPSASPLASTYQPISSPGPSHLPAFKNMSTLARSLTPPTLHPLTTAQDPGKSDPQVVTNPWPLQGVYPGIINPLQYQQLSMLQQAQTLNSTAHQSATRRKRGHEVPPSAHEVPAHLHPLTIRADHASSYEERPIVIDAEKLKISPQTAVLHDGRMVLPQGYPLSMIPGETSGRSLYSRGGADRPPEKMKFKMHHVNDKDFQQDRSVERKRRRAVKQFDSAAASHKIINVVDNDIPPSSKDGVMGGVTTPQIYTNITHSSDTEDDTIITVDNASSSEGTVSVSPSPPASVHSTKEDINITVVHEDPKVVGSELPFTAASDPPPDVSKPPTGSGGSSDKSAIGYGGSQDSGRVLRHDVFMSPYIKDDSTRELAIVSLPPSPSPSLPQAINTTQPFEMEEEENDFVMVSTMTIGQSSSGFINTFVPVSSDSPPPVVTSNSALLSTGYVPHSSPMSTTPTTRESLRTMEGLRTMDDENLRTMDETGSTGESTDSVKSLELDIDIQVEEEEENDNESPPSSSPPVHSEDVVDISLSEYREFSTNTSHSAKPSSLNLKTTWISTGSTTEDGFPALWQNTDTIDIASSSALLSPPSEEGEGDEGAVSPVANIDSQPKIPLTSSKVDDLVAQDSVDHFEKHKKEPDSSSLHSKPHKHKLKESRLGAKVAKHLATSKPPHKLPSTTVKDNFFDKQSYYRNDRHSSTPKDTRDVPHSDETSKQKRRDDSRLSAQQPPPPRLSPSPSNPRYNKHGYPGNDSTPPRTSHHEHRTKSSHQHHRDQSHKRKHPFYNTAATTSPERGHRPPSSSIKTHRSPRPHGRFQEDVLPRRSHSSTPVADDALYDASSKGEGHYRRTRDNSPSAWVKTNHHKGGFGREDVSDGEPGFKTTRPVEQCDGRGLFLKRGASEDSDDTSNEEYSKVKRMKLKHHSTTTAAKPSKNHGHHWKEADRKLHLDK